MLPAIVVHQHLEGIRRLPCPGAFGFGFSFRLKARLLRFSRPGIDAPVYQGIPAPGFLAGLTRIASPVTAGSNSRYGSTLGCKFLIVISVNFRAIIPSALFPHYAFGLAMQSLASQCKA
jgi:hypothetical protein